MTGFSVARTTFAAAAMLAASLAATMAADLGAQPAAGVEGTRVAVPLPKARPVHVHKRIARTAYWRRAIVRHEPAPSSPYWFWRPREQVVAQWSMLIVGIGY